MAPTQAATAAAAALSTLASCNLKELHLKRADGSRTLDTLHSTCRAAGLIPHGAPDGSPKERYLAVFDAALTGGLGCWILDYAEVVCADRHLTSNDPLEAYLLDGGFVKAWAQACLQRAEQAATSALQTEAAFLVFQGGPLQRQLSQMRVLTAVLRALDRIRAVAAGGSALAVQAAAAGGAAAQDRLSVRSELRTALLLEQGFQVMDWVARQGLAGPRGGGGGGSSCGRFGSAAEWSRAVAARRARAAPRTLFLDSLLQSLSLSGAYPSASLQHLLHTLLLHVRDVEAPAWAAKLALLAYYLQDAGLLLEGGGPMGQSQAQQQPGAGGGGGRLEAALEDLRRTFRLGPADVGLWQCHYLLDCAAPDAPGSGDAHLGRACALLPACVTPATPFAFIEALLALGRPDVALAVDRGQAGSEAAVGSVAAAAGPAAAGAAGSSGTGCGRPCRSLPQALTLLEVRLRCGLLTEAFMLIRQHTADLAAAAAAAAASSSQEGQSASDAAAAPTAASAEAAEAEAAEHTRALLRRLAEWAAAADAAAAAEAGSGMEAEGAGAAAAAAAEAASRGGSGGGGGWLNRLTELPLNAIEEGVLVGWLAEEAEAGRPAGDLLPLFFLQRGRVSEAAAGWHKWEARQAALAAASGSRRAPLLSELVSSALDAAHAALPGPLTNVAVPALGLAAGDAQGGGSCLLPKMAPGQGAVGILTGLLTHTNPDQPLAVLPFHGSEPPPLLTRAVHLPPTAFAAAAASAAAPPPQAATAADAADVGGEAEAETAAAAVRPAAPAFSRLFPKPVPQPPQPPQLPYQHPHQQQQQPFAAMPLTLPSSAPFRVPPGTPGPDAFGGGGGAAGGLLFSVGAGVVAAGGPGGAAGVGAAAAGAVPASARTSKRSKPNDWLLG